jgi:hypothetical protein
MERRREPGFSRASARDSFPLRKATELGVL